MLSANRRIGISCISSLFLINSSLAFCILSAVR